MRNLDNVIHCKDYWRLASFHHSGVLYIPYRLKAYTNQTMTPTTQQFKFLSILSSSPWDFSLFVSLLIVSFKPLQRSSLVMTHDLSHCCYLSAPWSLTQPVSSFLHPSGTNTRTRRSISERKGRVIVVVAF